MYDNMRFHRDTADDESCCRKQLITSARLETVERNERRVQNDRQAGNCDKFASVNRKNSSYKRQLINTFNQFMMAKKTRKFLEKMGKEHNRHQQHNFCYHHYESVATMKTSLLLLVGTVLAVACCSAKLIATHEVHQNEQIQSRSGGLEPGDYIDEAGELDVMVNQQHIPTAQLMSAAGHVVPDNFFLPGSSIPAAIYGSRYNQAALASLLAQYQHQQQQQQMQQQQQVQPQQAQQSQQHHQQHENPATMLIDLHSYAYSPQTDIGRDNSAAASQIDLIEYLNSNGAAPPAALASALAYEQQSAAAQQASHQQAAASGTMDSSQAGELAALASSQHMQLIDPADLQRAPSGEQYIVTPVGSVLGPDYQIDTSGYDNGVSPSGGSSKSSEQASQYYHQQQVSSAGRPYGLPTKSSSKEPSGILKPLGNTKTISSPIIDAASQNAPKTNAVLEKMVDKLPASQTPTVFSFSSSKDPLEKVKGVNQKKRNVMRQAEQIAKMLIKSVNEKFGTNIGDQTDIPFLLSTLGPLGFAQNVLFDPTLLITLLNSAERAYLSDVIPVPAKNAIKPVLNLFRVPNKKRDKANILNMISYLTSIGTQTPSKPRHNFGIEKATKHNKNNR